MTAPDDANDPRRMSYARLLRHMRRNARTYSDMLIKIRRTDDASYQHEDRMLTWLVGLMGAGLFAVPTLINAACATTKPLGFVAAPWAAGVLLALLGRIVGGWHRRVSNRSFTARWGDLRTLSIRIVPRSEARQYNKDVVAIVNETTDKLKALAHHRYVLHRWSVFLSYITVAAFAAGIVGLFWRISTC